MADLPPLSLIAAVARNGVIGKDGGLPWHVPEDLRHFRRTTMGHAVVMGRRTHASVGRALPGRRNIVVTSDPSRVAPDCEAARSVEEAVAMARATDPEPFVIGGASVYAAALPVATRFYLTEVRLDPDGDTFFPPFDRAAWREADRREGDGVAFLTLVRA